LREPELSRPERAPAMNSRASLGERWGTVNRAASRFRGRRSVGQLVPEDGLTQVSWAVHGVPASPALRGSRDVSVGEEVGDDFLGCAFGDSHCFGDVASSDRGLARDAEQDVRVIRENSPRAVVSVGVCHGICVTRIARVDTRIQSRINLLLIGTRAEEGSSWKRPRAPASAWKSS
jgi:hypothetical protein